MFGRCYSNPCLIYWSSIYWSSRIGPIRGHKICSKIKLVLWVNTRLLTRRLVVRISVMASLSFCCCCQKFSTPLPTAMASLYALRPQIWNGNKFPISMITIPLLKTKTLGCKLNFTKRERSLIFSELKKTCFLITTILISMIFKYF